MGHLLKTKPLLKLLVQIIEVVAEFFFFPHIIKVKLFVKTSTERCFPCSGLYIFKDIMTIEIF
jgi:hypothetical protein